VVSLQWLQRQSKAAAVRWTATTLLKWRRWQTKSGDETSRTAPSLAAMIVLESFFVGLQAERKRNKRTRSSRPQLTPVPVLTLVSVSVSMPTPMQVLVLVVSVWLAKRVKIKLDMLPPTMLLPASLRRIPPLTLTVAQFPLTLSPSSSSNEKR
jgi:hypothetical protein